LEATHRHDSLVNCK